MNIAIVSAVVTVFSALVSAGCIIYTTYRQGKKEKELNKINRMFEYKAKYYGEFFDSVAIASHPDRKLTDSRDLIANMLKTATFADGETYIKVLQIIQAFAKNEVYDSAKLSMDCVELFRNDLENCLEGKISPQKKPLSNSSSSESHNEANYHAG